MTDNKENWNGLAEQLETVAQAMMDQSKNAPDEFDEHMVILWSRSLMHCAIEMRFFADDAGQG